MRGKEWMSYACRDAWFDRSRKAQVFPEEIVWQQKECHHQVKSSPEIGRTVLIWGFVRLEER